MQQCLKIPRDEKLKTLIIQADEIRVHATALRSSQLEYPAFDELDTADPEKLTTEFDIGDGKHIIGVYGCFDKADVDDETKSSAMLAGLGFVVWAPPAPSSHRGEPTT